MFDKKCERESIEYISLIFKRETKIAHADSSQNFI